MDFSIEEIREQLESMGYKNVPADVLSQMKRDLNDIPPEDFLSEDKEPDDSYQLKHFSHPDSSGPSNHSPLNVYSYKNEDTQERSDLSSHHKASAPLSREVIHVTNGPMRRKVASRRVVSETTPEEYDFDADLQTNIGPLSPVQEDYPVRPVLKKSANLSRGLNKASNNPRDLKSGHSGVHVQRHFDPSMRRARFADDPVEAIKNYTTESIGTKDFFMEPSSSKGKSKSFKKADPVQRYHDYRRIWRVQSEPGQDGHKKLRWAVKAAMLVHEVPTPGPRTKPQVDSYIVNSRSEAEMRKNSWNVAQRRQAYYDDDDEEEENIF